MIHIQQPVVFLELCTHSFSLCTHCVYEDLLLQYGHFLLQLLLCPLQKSVVAPLHLLHVLEELEKQVDGRIKVDLTLF